MIIKKILITTGIRSHLSKLEASNSNTSLVTVPSTQVSPTSPQMMTQVYNSFAEVIRMAEICDALFTTLVAFGLNGQILNSQVQEDPVYSSEVCDQSCLETEACSVCLSEACDLEICSSCFDFHHNEHQCIYAILISASSIEASSIEASSIEVSSIAVGSIYAGSSRKSLSIDKKVEILQILIKCYTPEMDDIMIECVTRFQIRVNPTPIYSRYIETNESDPSQTAWSELYVLSEEECRANFINNVKEALLLAVGISPIDDLKLQLSRLVALQKILQSGTTL